MTLGATPCACGGNNPNCFRCWGTGMVEPKASPQPDEGKYLGSRLAKKTKPRSLVSCAECGQAVRNLAAHQQKAHGPVRNLAAHQQKSHSHVTKSYEIVVVPTVLPKTKTLHVCGVCGATVKSLTRHFERTGHSPTASTGADSKVVRHAGNVPARVVSPTVQCPRCGARFPNVTQLASHMVGSHGQKAFFQLNFDHARKLNREKSAQKSKPLKRGGNQPASGQSSKEANIPVGQEPQLDAKKHWGHAFRDHGQFGSYPAHDDMDDESSA